MRARGQSARCTALLVGAAPRFLGVCEARGPPLESSTANSGLPRSPLSLIASSTWPTSCAARAWVASSSAEQPRVLVEQHITRAAATIERCTITSLPAATSAAAVRGAEDLCCCLRRADLPARVVLAGPLLQSRREPDGAARSGRSCGSWQPGAAVRANMLCKDFCKVW